MGYFSNGTEGMDYESRYCSNCVNWRERDDIKDVRSCPVMDLHFWHNSDQCKKTKAGELLTSILSDLIPRDEKGFNGECSMFLDRTVERDAEAEYLEKLRFQNEPVMGLVE